MFSIYVIICGKKIFLICIQKYDLSAILQRRFVNPFLLTFYLFYLLVVEILLFVKF